MSRDHPHDSTDESQTATSRNQFVNADIDRRTFMRLSAATGGALAVPGRAAAESHAISDARITDRCEYIINYTPDAYEASVVIEFSDRESLDSFASAYEEEIDEEMPRPAKAVTRTEPTLAAHAHLTADEVADVLEIDGVESMEYSPGANPFWKLDGGYQDQVFPPVETSRGYLSHAEVVEGLSHLAADQSDRLNFYGIGQSPGWENTFTDTESDPQEVYLAEVTTDADDETAVAEKDKVVFTLSIHGDERSGVEAGVRLIEDIATGAAPAFDAWLDDLVLVFLLINPDGWVARNPDTAIPWVDEHDWNFQRGNASTFRGSPVDTNRQYPTIGWTNPGFRPAEPDGAPAEWEELVPDALAVVEHLREYDNVAYVCDYHGMYVANHMVNHLESNAPYDHDQTHALDEISIQIGEGMVEYWGDIDAIGDDIAAAETQLYDFFEEPYVPQGDGFNGFLEYGTIYDMLNYQVTGALLGWAGQPEEFGGLGAITLVPEMILSNHFTSAIKDWKPYWSRHYAQAYQISMREITRLAATETDATVATGGKDIAYVTSDELTRRSADLSHTDESPGAGHGRGQDRATRVQQRHETVQPGPSQRAAVGTQASGDTHSMAFQFDGVQNATEGTIQIINPAGNVVHEIDLTAGTDPTAPGNRRHDFEEWYQRRPADGEWTVAVTADTEIDVRVTAVESEAEHPDPEAVLGYPQTEYVVNPMKFFADLSEDLEDGSLEGVRMHDVRIGRLLRGQSGKRQYDTLVVSTAAGLDDEQYLAEIEAFVDAGGDLVVTDAGVHLLGALDIGDAAAITPEDINDLTLQFANLQNRDLDDNLLQGIRDQQLEIWKGPQLGYTVGVDQPATVVDHDAFTAAGGSVAGEMGADGDVGAGTLSAGDAEINVIGSVLPPAQQTELHPFGMADYAVSFMGRTLLCNALGVEQRRYVDGELRRTYGSIR